MKVKGLVWLGTRTGHFEQMSAFCRDLLGMAPRLQQENFAVFDMPNGDRFEIFGAESPFNTFMKEPVAGFLVEDIVEARAEMETQGIEFIGPIEHGDNGYAWTDFRAPDGFIYELTQYPEHPGNS